MRLTARHRASSRSAGRVLKEVFFNETRESKESCLSFLVESIDFISAERNDRWGVTLYDWGVRMNVGWVNCINIVDGEIHLLLELKSAPYNKSPFEEFEGDSYKHAPGCKMLGIRFSESATLLPALRESHNAAILIAARGLPSSQIRKAHSVGVTKFLSGHFRRAVSDPTYLEEDDQERSARNASQNTKINRSLADQYSKSVPYYFGDYASSVRFNRLTREQLRERIDAGDTNATSRKVTTEVFQRRADVRYYVVVHRAEGFCEFCKKRAPFKTQDGKYYLESHHVDGLAMGGIDALSNCIALCPNCHRRADRSADRVELAELLRKKLLELVRKR